MPDIEALALNRHKMALISGPRQCGKTTLAKSQLRNPELYFNWDQLKFRRLWTQYPDTIAESALRDPLPRIVLDELHKNRRWKTELKGFYDEHGDKIEILVTGSARLNTYRKGGDSLFGRFHHFHLHPLSISELSQNPCFSLNELRAWIDSNEAHPPSTPAHRQAFDSLLRFGGFPEPLLAGRDDLHRLWQASRLDLLIRQDLRDMTRITELSQVEVLASLLPTKVGSPLSVQSLREDLEVAHTTVQRWLRSLEALYFQFELKPYSKSVARALKKEGKIYLFDWSSVEEPGARFENMVASHLLKLCDHWTDAGQAHLELNYLRNKERREVDFLIVKDRKPWFTVEAKRSDLTLDKTFQVFQRQLEIPHFQIVGEPGIARFFKTDTGTARVVSFGTFFSRLP